VTDEISRQFLQLIMKSSSEKITKKLWYSKLQHLEFIIVLLVGISSHFKGS